MDQSSTTSTSTRTLTRPRLLEVLRGRFERRVTAVVAGPGFGKSTLLAQAAAENSIDPLGIECLVTCDRDDSAASVLAGSICRALAVATPDGTEPVALARAVGEAVTQHAPLEVSIVLDDVHEIEPDSSGAELLSELVARLPATGHVTTASRRSPPIPLARMVARGDALRLTEADLAFTDEEMQAFAALRGVDAGALGERGRWPALAELVASEPGLVEEYLWDEALTHLSPERRRALGVLAAIDGADADTMAAALGDHVDLDELTGDLPLASRSPRGWYRLSELWHQPLARSLDDSARREAQMRAGRHLRTREDHRHAFRLFSRAGAWDDALEVIIDACGVAPPAADVLSLWLEQLPPEHRSRPEGELLVGVMAKQRGEPAADALSTARAGFERSGNERGELACLPHLAQLGFWLGDAEIGRAAVMRAHELEAEGNVEASTLVALGRTVLAQAAGEYETVLEILDSMPAAVLTGPWRISIDPLRAEALIVLGRADEALVIAKQGRMFPALADTLPGALWLTGRTEEARVAAHEGLANASAATTQWVQAAATQAARFEAYSGDLDAARACLERSEALGPPASLVVQGRTGLAHASIEIARGDEQAAAAALSAALQDQPPAPGAAWRAQRRALPISYVLLPESRNHWDADDLGPTFQVMLGLARALVALREQGDETGLRDLPLRTDLVRAALPVPWAVELAVAASIFERPEGRMILDSFGARGRPWITKLTGSSHKRIASAAKSLLRDLPREPEASLQLLTLGPIELRRDGELVDAPDWRRDRVRHLLCYLVANRTVTREAAIDALWPDLDLESGANNLRVTLSYLLRVLEPARQDKEPSFFIRQDKKQLELVGGEHLETDLAAFETHLADADAAERDGAPSVALTHYREAVSLWRGPFLVDASALWAEAESERLRGRFLAAATRAGELALASDETDEAERLATRVLTLEPWSERAYRLLIAVHLARGDRPAARRALDRCHAMLDDLGVEPEPATDILERRLLDPVGAARN